MKSGFKQPTNLLSDDDWGPLLLPSPVTEQIFEVYLKTTEYTER